MDPITIRWDRCRAENGNGTKSTGATLLVKQGTDEVGFNVLNFYGDSSMTSRVVFPKSAIPELIAALTMISLLDG